MTKLPYRKLHELNSEKAQRLSTPEGRCAQALHLLNLPHLGPDSTEMVVCVLLPKLRDTIDRLEAQHTANQETSQQTLHHELLTTLRTYHDALHGVAVITAWQQQAGLSQFEETLRREHARHLSEKNGETRPDDIEMLLNLVTLAGKPD